ncbi:MAG: hypothetical protein KC933_03225 [Myxococcales bacterium]|nr:hypothetical protein [Myxococcales bacterium]
MAYRTSSAPFFLAPGLVLGLSPAWGAPLPAELEGGPTLAAAGAAPVPVVGLEAEVTGVAALVAGLTPSGATAEVGQAEVGACLGWGALTLEGALAWGEGQVAPATVVASVRLAGPDRALGEAPAAVTLVAGLMDVPVGLDFEAYSAADRVMVSLPAVVSGIHGGWGALGGQLQLGLGEVELRLFGAQAYLPEPAMGALGGRLRGPLGPVTVGATAAAQLDKALVAQDVLLELDAALGLGPVALSAEGMVRLAREAAAVGGGYVQAEYRRGWASLAARGELLADGARVTARAAVCLGAVLLEEALIARVELASDLRGADEAVLFQLVASR